MRRRILATMLAIALCFNYVPCYAAEVTVATETEAVSVGSDEEVLTESNVQAEDSENLSEIDVETEVTVEPAMESGVDQEPDYSYEGSLTESVNYQFVQNDDGSQKLVISGSGAMPDYGEWPEAPWGSNPAAHELVKEIEVHEGITAIGSRSFVNFNNVTKVTLPDTLQRIGSSAFYGAGNLISITVPGSVKNLDAYAFMYADGLRTVTLSEGVTAIGECAFWGCYSLQTLEVPRSVTSIGGYPFGYYDEDFILPQVNYAGNETEWSKILFGENVLIGNITFNNSAEEPCAHNQKEVISSTDATCTEDGCTLYKCQECGETVEEIISAGHNQIEEINVVEPTGESFGYILLKCARCQEELERIHISCLSPVFEISKNESVSFDLDEKQVAIVKFTPEEDGWYSLFSENDRSCDNYDSFCRLYDADWNWISEDDDCGGDLNFKLTADLIAGRDYYFVAFGNGYLSISMKVTLESQCIHSTKEMISSTDATCTEVGHLLYQCIECGEILDFTLTELGHSWIDGEITKEASCTESGIKTVICPMCGETGTESIPPCHNWSEDQVTIEPTVNSLGFIDFKCTRCEEEDKRIISYSTSYVDLSGGALVDLEEYQAKQLKFTVEEDGFYSFRATNINDYSETNTTICVLFDNDWNELSSAEASPLYDDWYYYFGAHLVAGEQYNLVIYEKAFNSISWVVYLDNYCIHSDWGNEEITKEPTCTESGIQIFTCQLCGETRTEGISPTGHNWSEYETTVEPTCTQWGDSRTTCLNCGYTFPASVPPLGHDYSDGYECIRCGEEKPVFETKYLFDFANGVGTYEIKKYTGRGGDVIIPEKIHGEAVTSIGWDAFYDCDNVTSITFPECLTEISRNAFGNCDGLTEVTIPESVQFVDYFAFEGCSNLKWVRVLSDNTFFEYNSLPSGCNVICKKDSRAHQSAIRCNTNINCYWTEPCDEHTYELTEVIKEATHTRDGLQRIYCSVCNDYYEEAILPEGHSFNEEGICTVCETDRETALFEADFDYEVDEDGNAILKFYSGNAKNLTIPAEIEGYPVTSVGYYDQDVEFFKNDIQLKTLTIPEGIINLNYTCRNCESLTSVSIPDSVTSLNGTFNGCTNLTDIVLPYGIDYIADDTFKNCKSLTELVIPDTVYSIGCRAFEGCENLSRVVLPVGINTIYKKTFKDCNSLTSIIIPENITHISYSAFENCTKLSRVTIWAENVFLDYEVMDPEEGVYGSVEVFNGCSSDLVFVGKANSNVQRYAENHGIAFEALDACEEHSFDIGTVIQEPTCRLEGKRKRTCSVCNYETIEAVPANGHQWSEENICTVCGEGIFVIWDNEPGTCVVARYNGDSENVVIPAEIDGKTVILVDGNVFWGRTDIVSVEFPDTVKWIEESAFSGCTNLVSVKLPDQLRSIGEYAFNGCSSLTDLVIPDSVESIGDFAFGNCENLKIYCKLNSAAHKYATREGIPYEIIEEEPEEPENNDLTIDHDVTVHIPDWSSSTRIPFTPEVSGTYEFKGSGSLRSYCALYDENNEYLGGDEDLQRDAYDFCYQAELIAGKTYTLRVWAFSYMEDTMRVSVDLVSTEPGEEPGEEKSDYTYSVLADGNCVITGYTGTDTNLVVPETIDGYTVVSIGDDAFSASWDLQSVSLPDTITEIGNSAFRWCANIESITLPNYLTKIGEDAFGFCMHLYSITLPDSVTDIGRCAFASSGLKSIVIPNGVTSISIGLFETCGNLSEVILPAELEYINDNAFFSCYYLKHIRIQSRDVGYGDRVFLNDNDLILECSENSTTQEYAIQNGVHYDLIGSEEREHVMGEPVTVIEPDCINYGLDKVTCNTCGITKEVTTEFSDHRWTDDNICEVCGLAKYEFSLNEQGTYTLEKYHGKEKNVVLPSSYQGIPVTRIHDMALEFLPFESVIIPDSVTEIGGYAFAYCNNLLYATLPDQITSVGSGAFSGCYNVTLICNPDTYIYQYAMDNGLKTCNHSNGVTSTTKTEATCTTEGVVISNCPDCGYSYEEIIPANGHQWDDSDHCSVCGIEKPDFLYSVKDNGTCEINSYLGSEQNLIIPAVIDGYTVTAIGAEAFKENAVINSVTIPATVTSIGYAAFANCPNLSEVVLPSNISDIGNSAFQDCLNLTSVITEEPGMVRRLVNSAKGLFSSSSSVNGRLGSYAFSGCIALTTVILPKTIQVIERYAFSYCRSLSDIDLPVSVVSIGEAAFESCDSLAAIVIPDQVTSIGDSAFAGCENLTYVTIPDSVESIGDNTFTECENVKIVCSEDSYANEYAQENDIPSTDVAPCDIHTPGEYVVDQEPAFGADGLKHYTCLVCGEEIKESIPALEYRLYGYQVVLNGNFDLKYYVEMTDNLQNHDDVTMRFTIGGNVYETGSIRRAGKYEIFMCELGAAEISDTITAELVYDGESHTISTYSVREYLNTIIQNPEQKAEYYEAQELAEALLIYSAYAQQYFDYNPEDLANSILESDSVADLVDSDVTGNITVELDDQLQTDDFSYYGASLICESDTYLRVYFNNNNDLTLDEIQEKYNIFIAGISNPSYEVGLKGNLFFITIKDIPAAELDSRFIIHLDTAETKSYIVYSPVIYIRSALESESVSQELKNMCKALWLYNQAANAYYERYCL